MSTSKTEDPLNTTLRHFDAVEANLEKATRHLASTYHLVPEGISFGANVPYENALRDYADLLTGLPPIEGWRPSAIPPDSDEIARRRLDAEEISEPEVLISLHLDMEEPERELNEYRRRLNRARRRFIRDSVIAATGKVDALVTLTCTDERRDQVLAQVKQIDVLLGSSFARPQEWSSLFLALETKVGSETVAALWSTVRERLLSGLFNDVEPIPVPAVDLGRLSHEAVPDTVVAPLKWRSLDDESFERLIFSLISTSPTYENAAWLTRTSAADRGRDLSAVRVSKDSLAGVTRNRVIVQCKHWLDRSVGPAEVGSLQAQMSEWEPPRVDVLIIATSGRFTTAAVSMIERHNLSDRALKIEMWPESHIERLLAERPALVAEFRLR